MLRPPFRLGSSVLPAGARCYLCGELIAPTDEWNTDHVPPKRFFARSVRRALNPILDGLPTHTACNTSMKTDEEYFVESMIPTMAGSTSGRAVLFDIRRSREQQHNLGLTRLVESQKGRVRSADGSLVIHFDQERMRRAMWKLIRGVHFLWFGEFLPEETHGKVRLFTIRGDLRRLQEDPTMQLLATQPSKANYPDVFDVRFYRAKEADWHASAYGLVMWNSLVMLATFHDPGCPCEPCTRPPHGRSD